MSAAGHDSFAVVGVCVSLSLCVCVCVWERECVCVRERERECLGGCVCVCVCVCVWKTVYMCVCRNGVVCLPWITNDKIYQKNHRNWPSDESYYVIVVVWLFLSPVAVLQL